MRLKRTIALCALLSTGACATFYTGAELTGPVATVSFHKGYGGQTLTTAGNQYYQFYDEPTCQPKQTRILTAITADVRTVRVAADRRIVVHGFANYLSTTGVTPMYGGAVGVNMAERICQSTGTFVPEAGHTYDVKQDAVPGRCSIAVIDRATGLAPASFRTDPVETSCAPYFAAGEGG